MNYVVGMMFDLEGSHVLLLRKKRGPAVVVGNWNGVGGKIEDGESPIAAMAREFHEEAGLRTDPRHWREFCRLQGPNHLVHFFFCRVDYGILLRCRAQTDEPVRVFRTNELPTDIMYNLVWMIAFLSDPTIEDHVIMNTLRVGHGDES